MEKIPLKGLRQSAEGLAEKVTKARGHYDAWKQKVKDLAGPQAKADYTPLKIQTMKAEARQEALKAVREVKAGMAETAGRVLPQRRRWSKASLLRDTKFSEAPDFLRGDRVAVTQFELLNAVKQLSTATWAQRLPNDALVEAIQDAVAREELPTLSVLVSEVEIRGDGKLKIQTADALKAISFPETTEAEQAFTAMEKSLREVDALENELLDPTSTVAQSRAEFFRWSREPAETGDEPEQPSAA